MRKITSILMLLLFVFSSGVSAQGIKASTDAEKHWYQIKNFRSGKYAAYGSETEIHQKDNSNYEKGLYWFVVADGAGYRIHNAGTNKIVDGHTWSDGGCVMYIKSNPHKTGYVCISKTSNLASACWDDQDQSSKIGDWQPTAKDADGTSWTFEEVTDAKTIARAELDYWITNVKVGTTPGSYPSTAIAAAKGVADNGEATADDYTNALATLKNAVSCPVAGKYYVITSAYDRFKFLKGATKSVCVDGQNLKWKTTDLTDKSMFWEIYPVGDKFVFKNYSTGTYISTCAGQTKPYLMGGTPAEQAVFNWYIGTDCNINIAGGSLHTENHNQGNGDNGNIVQYPGGSCTQSAWYIKEVDNVEKEMLQATIAKANILVGINPGQYPSTDAYSSALAAAQEILNSTTATKDDYDGKLTALETALEQAQTQTKNDLEVGCYYRIQNTSYKTYTGIELKNQSVGTSRMKNSALNENDPRQIWKLEKEGEKYYLVNVASGLYPQTIVSGSGNTTDVGAKNPSLNFSWKQHAEITSTSNAQYNIFFGQENNGQINVEANGNVNYWYGNNAHHYLWKVKKTEEEILALVNDWAKSQNLTDNAGATKLNVISDVAQVISPSEFAEPGVVNAAIDAVKAYADATAPTLKQAQALYNNYAIVNNYVNQANTYGSILDVEYDLKGQYGTIILPVNYASPQNVKFYTCGAADANGVLTLVETTTGTKKNQPYIVEYTGTDMPTVDNPKKYQIIGYQKGAETTNQTVGLLTGVLVEGGYVPSGSYILSKYKDRFAFYMVDGENVKKAQQYRCYLTNPAPTAVSAFYLNGEGETTGINALLNGNNGETEIYDLSGKRLNHLQKGINIVNGQKVLVK